MKENNKLTTESQVEFATSVLAFISTLPFLLIVFHLLGKIQNNLDVDYIQSYLQTPISEFMPEAPERYRYMILTVLFPILFMIFYYIFSKIKIHNIVIKKISVMYYVAFASITYLVVTLLINRQDMFKLGPYISGSLYINYTIIISIVLVLFIYLLNRYSKLTSTFNALLFGICALSILGTSYMFITSTCYSTGGFFNFDAFYFPVFEVFHGKTLGVDFSNQYGFYPYFVVGILKIFGNEISVLRYTTIMAFFVLITFGSLFLAIWLNFKNKILATITFFSILAIWIGSLGASGGSYFAYCPNRMMFISIILLICTLWNRAKSNRMRTILFLVGNFSIYIGLNFNLDAGLVVWAAWFLFHMYHLACKYKLTEKTFIKKTAINLLFTIGTYVLANLTIMLITFVRTGSFLSNGDFYIYQNIFYKYGFMMLPMPAVGWWNVLVIGYAFALVLALRRPKFLNIRSVSSAEETSMYFVLAVIGMGIFSYYQGRSIDMILPVIFYPGCILFGLFVDKLIIRMLPLKKISLKNISKSITEFAIIFSFILFSVYYALSIPYTFKYNIYLDMFVSSEKFNVSERDQLVITKLNTVLINYPNTDFIIDNESYYLTKLGIPNNTKISSNLNWFTKDDIKQIGEYFKNTQNSIVIDKSSYTVMGVDNQNILNTYFSETDLDDDFKLYIRK